MELIKEDPKETIKLIKGLKIQKKNTTLVSDIYLLKFYDEFLDLLRTISFREFLAFFLEFNYCSNENLPSETKLDHLGNHTMTLGDMVKNAFIKYLMFKLNTKSMSTNYNKYVNIFVPSMKPDIFIRYFDPIKEKITSRNYLVDFTNKIECTDEKYQESNIYYDCAVVGFFKLEEIGPMFYSLFKKFDCATSVVETRKIVVIQKPTDKNLTFEAITPHSTKNKNNGEYVLRSKDLKEYKEFLIPVEHVFNSLNEFILSTYMDDFIDYFDQIQKQKFLIYKEIREINNKYSKLLGL